MTTFVQYDAFHHQLIKGADGKPITAEFAGKPPEGWLQLSYDEDDSTAIRVFDARNHIRGTPELHFEPATGRVTRRFPILHK